MSIKHIQIIQKYDNPAFYAKTYKVYYVRC